MTFALPLIAALSSGALQVETLQHAGPADHRINVTVLGDGYTAADQTLLAADARSLVETLFAVSPYAQYRALFNIELVHVVSQDRGARGGDGGPAPSTALGAHFNCSGIQRLLCVDNGTAKVIAAQATPGFDLVVVLVNDSNYGGSGGDVATVSRVPEAGSILPHELGHTLAYLADEYSTPYPGFPACPDNADCPEPNATRVTRREELKWGAWMNSSTPSPTTPAGTDEIGVFAGCRYEESGIYRPFDDACLMKKIEHSFCPVCSEAMVRSFWKHVPPIESASPSILSTVTACGPLSLSVTTVPVQTSWRYLWSIDGVPSAGQTNQLTLEANALGAGIHEVSALAQDLTPLVRSDPTGALSDRHTWLVRAQPGAAGTCEAGPCDETASCENGACVATHRPAGTPCLPEGCAGTMKIGVCDAQGACVARSASLCTMNACDSTCALTCSSDDECGRGSCQAGACVAPSSLLAHGCSSSEAGPMLLAWSALASLFFRRRR